MAITSESLQELVNNNCLKFFKKTLTVDDVKIISSLLHDRPEINELSFYRCNLSDEGIATTIELSRINTLQVLKISFDVVGIDACKALAAHPPP